MQSRVYKYILISTLSLLVVVNIVGIALPAWYHTEHKHQTNSSSTNHTSTPSLSATSISGPNVTTASGLIGGSDSTGHTNSKATSKISTNQNSTNHIALVTMVTEDSSERPPGWDCEINVHIQEGLWQRYCIERYREGKYCVLNVQEWCDNLEFSDFNSFVLALQIVGDFILAVVLATVVYSQRKKQDFDLERSAVAVGTAGIFMLLGVLVYAAADTGEVNYQITDLHVGWAMCVAGGGACLLLAVHIMYRHVNHRQPTAGLGYYPISDREELPQQDVALLQDI